MTQRICMNNFLLCLFLFLFLSTHVKAAHRDSSLLSTEEDRVPLKTRLDSSDHRIASSIHEMRMKRLGSAAPFSNSDRPFSGYQHYPLQLQQQQQQQQQFQGHVRQRRPDSLDAIQQDSHLRFPHPSPHESQKTQSLQCTVPSSRHEPSSVSATQLSTFPHAPASVTSSLAAGTSPRISRAMNSPSKKETPSSRSAKRINDRWSGQEQQHVLANRASVAQTLTGAEESSPASSLASKDMGTWTTSIPLSSFKSLKEKRIVRQHQSGRSPTSFLGKVSHLSAAFDNVYRPTLPLIAGPIKLIDMTEEHYTDVESGMASSSVAIESVDTEPAQHSSHHQVTGVAQQPTHLTGRMTQRLGAIVDPKLSDELNNMEPDALLDLKALHPHLRTTYKALQKTRASRGRQRLMHEQRLAASPLQPSRTSLLPSTQTGSDTSSEGAELDLGSLRPCQDETFISDKKALFKHLQSAKAKRATREALSRQSEKTGSSVALDTARTHALKKMTLSPNPSPKPLSRRKSLHLADAGSKAMTHATADSQHASISVGQSDEESSSTSDKDIVSSRILLSAMDGKGLRPAAFTAMPGRKQDSITMSLTPRPLIVSNDPVETGTLTLASGPIESTGRELSRRASVRRMRHSFLAQQDTLQATLFHP